MLLYLIILLDDTAVSYCHYPTLATQRRLMGLDTLKEGIRFAMKENLSVQFVYPHYALPQEYRDVIETIDHVKIMPYAESLEAEGGCADVIVAEGIGGLPSLDHCEQGTAFVVRATKADLFANYKKLGHLLNGVTHLNVVITDVETFTDSDFRQYASVLDELSGVVEALYAEGKSPQTNILTDRMMLTEMNNCGAGHTNITLAPDGRFYVCPAFYQAATHASGNADSIGDLAHGPNICNKQLFRLDHAPLCRICDAYQCKRCVWMNRRATFEFNTPGHEQCVVAHLERNASRKLLNSIRKHGTFLPEREEIREIDYLDPFEIKEQW